MNSKGKGLETYFGRSDATKCSLMKNFLRLRSEQIFGPKGVVSVETYYQEKNDAIGCVNVLVSPRQNASLSDLMIARSNSTSMRLLHRISSL